MSEGVDMFAELVTLGREHWEDFERKVGVFADPPEGLVSAVAWVSDEDRDEVTSVLVWQTPAARGDFAVERVMPRFEDGSIGPEHGHPERISPLATFVRGWSGG